MSTALPRPNPFDITYQFSSHCAYIKCLDLEDRHTAVEKTGKLTVLICARFLGYMLIEAPTDAGREDFASEVARCPDDEALQALADLYKNHFIRCFLSYKGGTPIPTHHPSAPSFDARGVGYKSLSAETPKSHSEAKKRALTRDSYCCMLTGKLDDASVEAGLAVDDGRAVTVTRAAHIFDRSTNEDLNLDNKWEYAASVHAVLDRFGQIRTIDELNGTNIHRLENILTLDSSVHAWFDQLKVWLDRKPDDPINCYRPAATKSYYLREIQDQVRLNTPDMSNYPLPDPRYVAVHAACARVAHLSGAAAYIETVFRDMRDTKVLANNGGSGDVLYHALIRHGRC